MPNKKPKQIGENLYEVIVNFEKKETVNTIKLDADIKRLEERLKRLKMIRDAIKVIEK